MYKHILALISGTEGDSVVFQTALLAARPFVGHLSFLHVKPDVTEIMVSMTSSGDGFGGSEWQGLADDLEADATRHAEAATSAFTAFCTKEGISTGDIGPDSGLCADLVVETGNENQWLAEHGHFADLIVAGRTWDGDDVVIDALETALMDTGKPVLIAPAKPPGTLLGTVVIAWKDTAEAASAIAAAMPLIDRAERVVIVSVGEGDDETARSIQRLRDALRWHVAATTLKRIEPGGRPAVELLLETARNLGATLLVMGGYSHARLREVVFGGFTKQILRAADIPVLMAH